MNMHDFAEGHRQFRNLYFKAHEKEFLRLVKEGQRPKALYIGCCDSRVIPDAIMASQPGDLFVHRNIGNFVPPFESQGDYNGTAAAIEYAVNVLEVGDIIVCGHSHCGAIACLYQKLDNPNLTNVQKWLELGMKAREIAEAALSPDTPKEDLLSLTEMVGVLCQIERLFTYPFIVQRMQEEKLFLHGWYYRIDTGDIECFDTVKHEFVPLREMDL